MESDDFRWLAVLLLAWSLGGAAAAAVWWWLFGQPPSWAIFAFTWPLWFLAPLLGAVGLLAIVLLAFLPIIAASALLRFAVRKFQQHYSHSA